MKKYGIIICAMGLYFTCLMSFGENDSCFRCMKSGKYGSGSYPKQIDKTICNIRTVDYLRTVGYRCHPN